MLTYSQEYNENNLHYYLYVDGHYRVTHELDAMNFHEHKRFLEKYIVDPNYYIDETLSDFKQYLRLKSICFEHE